MLAGAILTILVPLSRGKKYNSEPVDALAVYRQQLLELDEQSDLTSESKEALEIERAEIARRILKESRKLENLPKQLNLPKRGRIIASLTALIVLPAISLPMYFHYGSPGTPDVPLSSQRVGKLEDKSVEEMVQMTERHLAKNPNDARGWTVLANVYGRLNRPSDRARAFENIIRIEGPTPGNMAELGEALTVADGNIVSSRARKLFERAWAQDKSTLKASVYLALALEQEGRFDLAINRWINLAKSRTDDMQWQAMTDERLVSLKNRLGQEPLKNPSAEDVKNASEMSAEDRTSMIAGMVTKLAVKLKENPNNIKGWMRLIRSYAILKRDNDAGFALKEARAQFKNEPVELAKLDDMAKQMNIKEPVE